MKFVSIVIGSRSDYEVMKSCSDTLEAFGVNYEMISLLLTVHQKEQKSILQQLRKRVHKYSSPLLVWLHT